jgi:RNA recognition motif-containing protein
MNIYVGNLPFAVTEEDIRQAFKEFGEVTSVAIIKDKFTGESRGFAFVEMAKQSEGQAAIAGLNGKEFKGRNMTVNEARPRTETGHGGGGGFGSGRPGGGEHRGGPGGDRRGGPGGGNRGGANDRGGGHRSW